MMSNVPDDYWSHTDNPLHPDFDDKQGMLDEKEYEKQREIAIDAEAERRAEEKTDAFLFE